MLVLGACVAPSSAAAFCGPASRPIAEGGCRPLPACEPGRARDLETGACVSLRDVRRAAAAAGIDLPDDAVLACDEGDELVAAASPAGALRLACVEAARAAAPARADEGRPGAGPKAMVDLGAWLRAALGAPTDPAGACARLARSSLGALAASAETVFTVALRVPDNDVTQVTFGARWIVPPRDVEPAAAAAELERAIAPRIEALRALGGTATAAVSEAEAKCPAPRRAPPRATLVRP
jgi:hypothetical protein